MMLIVAVLYWTLRQDTPEGNIPDLHRRGVAIEAGKKGGLAVFMQAASNYRVWMLAITYGACFGVEIFIHAVAATYFVDRFGLTLTTAGLAAGSFGLLALFARALGGIASDKVARTRGLGGRTWLLFALMVGEGVGLLAFSSMTAIVPAVIAMLAFGLFTHIACGSTYALVPFIDRKALGGVAGIIGAGGNIGAVAAGFLVKWTGNLPDALYILGWISWAGPCSAAPCAPGRSASRCSRSCRNEHCMMPPSRSACLLHPQALCPTPELAPVTRRLITRRPVTRRPASKRLARELAGRFHVNPGVSPLREAASRRLPAGWDRS